MTDDHPVAAMDVEFMGKMNDPERGTPASSAHTVPAAGKPDTASVCCANPPLKTSVLFVCVHNAGRSQMAAGYVRALAGDRIDVLSAGSAPADQINAIAVAAMAEEGIDITAEAPTLLTTNAVKESDVVITMGCGDACPVFPGKRYEDWKLDDPAGQEIDQVRQIRDDIKARIQALIDELEL
ncbi:MAG: protein-tyrosine-phosphatase [Actinomycetes bacterium]|jgi:arsenate reductase